MAGILRANLTAIEAELPGVSFGFGYQAKFENDLPPRIIWVPTQDPFTAARSTSATVKSVRTREATVEAIIWGCSFDQTEAVLHNLVSVLARKYGGVHHLGSARWIQSDDADMGWVVAIPIGLDIPVSSKLIELPTTPGDASLQPGEDASVTIVEGTPAINEVNAVIGAKTFEKPTTP